MRVDQGALSHPYGVGEASGDTTLSEKAHVKDEADRFRLLVENVTDYAICMLDLSGKVLSWNQGAARFKGYSEAEIVGQHFSIFYSEQDRKNRIPERNLTIAKEEGRFEGEDWRLRKNGERFWAHVVIDPVRDHQGRLIGFAKISRDLTDRYLAQQTMRHSEEQFRLLVQNVTDYAIFMLNPDGTVANWNLGAQRIKLYLPEEIIGKHFSCFYTAEDRASDQPAYALKTVRDHGRYEKEGWRLRKDGSRFWANVVIDPIYDFQGTLIGYGKVTRDITERKNDREALEQTREALFQSQKMEAVGQLSGGIAHDFNNLLMAISGSLELLRKRLPDDPRLRSLLNNAAQGAERGRSLIQRMLAFARRQSLRPTSVNLPLLLNGMSDLLNRTLGAGMNVQLRFPANIPSALVDSNQLELAVLNLAVNARDSMPEGGIIYIEGHETLVASGDKVPPGRYVILTIRDTGMGMSPDTLSHAMEPFFTTKGIGKGTGLGLSMVHGMAEQSGGALRLHSVEGEGTRAEIWLPIATPTATEPSIVSIFTPTSETRSLKILAVDDDALVLMNTTAMLEDQGHTVLEACSAEEALSILGQDKDIALLITDQGMPRITGLQMVQQIHESNPDLPVIIATGYAELPAHDLGKFVKLDKPFTEEDLARAITRAIM